MFCDKAGVDSTYSVAIAGVIHPADAVAAASAKGRRVGLTRTTDNIGSRCPGPVFHIKQEEGGSSVVVVIKVPFAQ